MPFDEGDCVKVALPQEDEVAVEVEQILHPPAPAPGTPRVPLSDAQLLKNFLSLPPKLRRVHFADTSDVAARVGVSRRTIQLWIESGSIRAVRVGRRYQVVLASVLEYLEGMQEGA